MTDPNNDPFSAVVRRMGRPVGKKTQVVLDPRALGVHHFAFVRSILVGLDLRASFERYVAWSEPTTDLRYVQNRFDALLKQIIEAGRHWDNSQPDHAKIGQLLDLLRSNAPIKAAAILPSLEDWADAEGMDPDMYAEAELLAEYKAAFGLDNADAVDAGAVRKDPTADRVRALNYIETVLAKIPASIDRLEAWFARSIVKCLRNAGLLTLGDLVNFVNVHGYRWHGRIAGIGAERASQILTWLKVQQEHLNMAISDAVDEPKSRRGLRLRARVDAHQKSLPAIAGFTAGDALVNHATETFANDSLLSLLSSDALSGKHGVFRSHMANTLGANNDPQAVNAWLARYREKQSTQQSYRKEVERFLLWCARELKKPLSSVTGQDCLKYREFLKAVPATWIEPSIVLRIDPKWRAFRGQPSASSQKQALVILQTMFSGLVDAGYLVANPMRSVMKHFDLPSSKVDIRRSFTEAEWAHVLNCLDAMPAGPEQVRLRCILELLVSSGIRLDELAKATHADMRIETLPGLPDTWVLTVTGKRNKMREIPLNADVVAMLAQHAAPFLGADLHSEAQDTLPLIRTIENSVPQWVQASNGELIAQSMTVQTGAALSRAGIYSALKRFFRSAAKSAGQAGLEPLRFERASTHWMRHSFVRNALVDGLPVEVVSELAGHASIDTTSIYATQELARKITAMSGLRRRTNAAA